MCLPPMLLAAAAMGLGGAMSFAGQQQAEHAKTRAFNAEEGRQHQFTNEQVQKFRDSLDTSQQLADPNAEAKAVASREGALNSVTQSAAPSAGGYLPGAASAPSVVATAGAKAGATADAHTANLAHTLATLGGFGDVLQHTNIQIGRDAGDIGQIGSFMKGSLGALQPELDAAAQKGKTLRTLGGLAQQIGASMLAGGAGAGGAPVGGGTASGMTLNGAPTSSGILGLDGYRGAV